MNVLGQVVAILADTHTTIRPAQKTKICWQHAYHRIPLMVQCEGSPYHGGIAPKPALPQVVAQNHHWRTACSILFWNEVMARRELYPQHGKQARACVASQHPLRLPFAGQVE